MKNDVIKNITEEEKVSVSREEYETMRASLKAMETQIAEKDSQIAEKDLVIAQKNTLIAEQESQLAWFFEQLKLSKHKTFSFSSEKAENLFGEQMSLFFNEAEHTADPSVSEIPFEPDTKEVAAYKRKARTGTVRDILPDNVPVEVVEHRPESTVCPECGAEMVEIGKETKQTLVIIPAQVKIREDRYYTFACKECEKDTEKTIIVKTAKEPSLIPGSFASSEAVAYLMIQKFVMASPLYRLEKELNGQGIQLSRQTMSNWTLKCTEYLKPIYDELHRRLVAKKVLHADETTLQVLREPGKAAQSKSYMWLYRTSGNEEHPIVLYEYKPNRKTENPEKFLAGFEGYLHTDGYEVYHKLSGITVVGCWAHARRNFTDAVKIIPEKDRSGTMAAEGLKYIEHLFALEKEYEHLSPEDRYSKRLAEAEPVIDALFAWAKKQKPVKSLSGKAVNYLIQQEAYLRNYLKDGRTEITNNRAERSIKPFVIGRKNFLFANTPNGAESSAIIYSLIETAKENQLDPYRYLKFVFDTAPGINDKAEMAVRLLPENAPAYCRAY